MLVDPINKEGFALQLARSLGERATVLRASAELEGTGAADPRDLRTRRFLERGSEIVRACAALGQMNNPTAIAILARAHLESLIQLLWVTLSEQNAVDLTESTSEELIRMAKVNMRSGKLSITNEHTGKDETASLLSDERMKTTRPRRSIEACAQAAGVSDLYNVFYRFMSLETHGHKLDGSSGKSDWELTAMHLQSIGGLTQALGHVGVRWLVHRQRPNNEELRGLLGLGK